MDYLLSLCEEMRLLVLAAPGPYICSETQGGGHPTWLVAKKDIRIRHSASSFNKPFDVQYSHYCREWLHQILPIIAAHEITAIQSSSSKKRGCVIGVQIENENFENFKGIPVGCADDMRYLARVARECGITVPLFHNDGFEEGSWVSRDDNHREHGHSTFGLDWYAYDKYVVFCPTSTPQSLLVDPGPQGDLMVWEEWKPSCVEHCMDSMETKVRGFGGCAASAPMFIAELQGGWFNHYMLPCSYDDIYNYYGDDYTRLVLDSSLAQGVTMLNLYMAYGGTNWGTLGDPDVYTSYDYSACVREYGYLSGRGRKLRLGMAFARSFGAAVVARSERVAAKRVIEVVPRRMLNGQRRAGDGVVLSFWRNFSEKRTEVYTATVRGRPGVVLQGRLQYKRSFVGIGEYTSAGSGLRLLLATMPVHVRTHVKDSGSRAQRKLEVWVLQNDEFVGGELAFDGRVEVTRESRTLRPSVELVAGQTSIIRFVGDIGWCALRREGRVEDAGELLLLFLKEQDLMTLVPSFEENFWFDAEDKASAAVSTCDPLSLVWGAYGVQHDIKSGKLDIEWQCGQEFAYALPFLGFPGLRIRQRSASSTAALLLTRGPVDDGTPIPAKLGNWTTRDTQFEDLPWTELMLTGRDRSTPSLDSIDLGFTSGHVIYKLTINAKTFQPTLGVNLKLSINMRHRAVISLNGKHILGGHTTYAHRLMKAGSKQGPDPFKDTKDYILPFEQLYTDGQDNVVYVIVESFGLNRQAFILNDIRCRRGILNVGLVSVAGGGDILGLFSRRIEFALHVTGVDIRTLNEPFNLCGFPDEHVKDGWMQASDCGAVAKEGAVSLFRLGADKLPRWFSGVMEVSPAITGRGLRVPLRFHVTGTATAHIWVDGVYLARYYGNGDCVQRDFYIPDTYAKGSRLVKVLVYDGRPGSDWIGIEVKGWEVAEGWSGNLMEGGEVFATCVEHW
ncbi:glycoside hydrolase superfamily [Chytriomyces sp. MP71]|nr:glycoside hydrolase superfamily [Chytriomyces sp. MP71]